jgi:S1-C subfamily serine protease
MLRASVLAMFVLVAPSAVSAQAVSVLHIKVALVDDERGRTPVPRHALLISDNPATAPPRRILTDPDGTADIKLRPGNYTIESDRPVVFHGKAYQWIQMVDVTAGRDTVLELTADNAEVDAAPAVTLTTTADAPWEADPSLLLPRWQDSIVELWTATAHASGFVIDARGLIATNQRVIGTATSVEVQLTPAVKVTGTVLIADRVRDVAILLVDPTVVASMRPVPLPCKEGQAHPVVQGLKIFTISSPLHQPKDIASGTVSRVDTHAVVSDFDLAPSGAGGPVFAADGGVIGITTLVDDNAERRAGDSRVIPLADACEVVASAEAKYSSAGPPSAAHLPVEPGLPFPTDALKDAAEHRAGSLSPYQVSSSAFDVAFITPVMTYGVQFQSDQASRRGRSGGTRTADAGQSGVQSLLDFSNWSEYVESLPPVLLVRVTPKLVQGFWRAVARGAAQTQGVSLPQMKHFNGSFSRMRAYCGSVEVTPIHPFKIERRLSETEVVDEGLYAFDPAALGPQCSSVRLALYSEKEPEKEDSRLIEPRIVQQIWQDFAPYRAANQ